MSATFLILVAFLFKETQGGVLLRRKARTLNENYDALKEAGFQGTVPSSDQR